MEYTGYVASICVGLILGLLGGGGSILSIPILVYLFQFDVVVASAYSLFMVGITSLVGSIPKYKEHLVNIRTGLLVGIPSIISIFITRRWIVHAIPEIIWNSGSVVVSKRMLLLGLFAVLMLIASASMIRERQGSSMEQERLRAIAVIAQGLIIGFITGLVGAGGGFLIIPALVMFTGLRFKAAVGTSLFIIAVNSLSGFAGDLFNFKMDWGFLFTITALAVLGIFVGNALSRKVPSALLRKIFGWFILITGCWILIHEAFHLL
jgi:uncharacterized membrane protein YfcA